MNFDAIITALREGADSRCAMAADARERAAELIERAKGHAEVAQSLDLLADALATGQLTKGQLRAIVAGATAEDETDAAPVNAWDAYTDAQLDGTACIGCGRKFGENEPNRPVYARTPRGQMFEHIYPDDCKAVAK